MRKKKFFLFPALLTVALALTGCSPAAAPESSSPAGSASPENTAYHAISPEEAKEMLDAGTATVVDVRRAEEYAEKHLPGAVLVPNESIGDAAPEALPDKDATLLVYCRTGVRSKEASDKLVALGYRNVYDMQGGITAWTYETEAGESAP